MTIARKFKESNFAKMFNLWIRRCPTCNAQSTHACFGAPYRNGSPTRWDEAVHNSRRTL